MELFRGYVPTRNKQCLEKFKGVEKLKTRSEVQDLDEYAGILGEETILIDVDDAETSELYFAQIRKTDCLIHRLDSTIATLRSSLTSTGSQLKQDKVQTSGPKNTLEETITKIIDLEAKINVRIDELVSMKQEAFTMINRIPDLDQQNILIGRYIQLKKWEDISEELNYSMQWVFELHGKGLLAFAKANSDFLNNRENQSATGSKQSKESVE